MPTLPAYSPIQTPETDQTRPSQDPEKRLLGFAWRMQKLTEEDHRTGQKPESEATSLAEIVTIVGSEE